MDAVPLRGVEWLLVMVMLSLSSLLLLLLLLLLLMMTMMMRLHNEVDDYDDHELGDEQAWSAL